MRGTWYYVGHRDVLPDVKAAWKRVYKKIKLTKHGITFTRRTRVPLHGHYVFMISPDRHWSSKEMGKAEKYAHRHRWLNAFSLRGHSFSFSDYWLHIYESNYTGELSQYGRQLSFENAYIHDYYRK